ncbi:MAG: hypothetical protein WBV55_08365 [Candidatus Sulfotelmatobacter sp.]
MIQWRKFVCGVMIAIFPAFLNAQVTDRGLIYSDGGTWLNESPAPAVTTIFPDSLVQTQSGYSARINMEGTTVLIGPETLFQFQGNELTLDHGNLHLDTAREMKVLIGCVTVTPVTSDRTQYTVTDVDGRVKVVALKNDVKIHLHGAVRRSKQGASSDLIVREGEQATRRDRCGALMQPTQGDGPILGRRLAWGAGLVVAGAVACLGLCHGDDPVSPSKP